MIKSINKKTSNNYKEQITCSFFYFKNIISKYKINLFCIVFVYTFAL